MDELQIVTGRDQALPVNSVPILEQVEVAIKESIESGNVYIALNLCRDLIQATKLSGIALAKTLYLLRANWAIFTIEGEFDEIVFDYIGVTQYTVDRYIKVWSLFAEQVIPDNVREKIMQKNIKDQIPIANAIAQGHEITPEQWNEIAKAPDFNTVSRIVREDVKGAEPRSSGLQIKMDNIGTLWAWKTGKRYFIGSLEVTDEEIIVQQAIERLISHGGVMRE